MEGKKRNKFEKYFKKIAKFKLKASPKVCYIYNANAQKKKGIKGYLLCHSKLHCKLRIEP